MTADNRDLPAPPPDLPVLPAGLRERVLAASLRARDAGRPVPDAPQISPAEAFSRAASAFYAVLCFLDDDGWRTPVLRGLDVQGLVGHLIGVEEDVHRALAGDPAVADAEHVESTQATALDQAARRPAQTRADWRRAVDRTLDLVRAADARARVAVHGLRMPVGALLIVRAFELWTHENDIRQAVGWAPSVPDPSTLRLMTDLAARLLPHAGSALPEPVDVRLVLTGPGGGTWDVTMGGPSPAAPPGPSPAAPPGESPAAPPGEPPDAPPGPSPAAASGESPDAPPGPSPAAASVAIVTDAVGFCRLAANRVTPDDLDVDVTGDPARAAAVLAAATTLALD